MLRAPPPPLGGLKRSLERRFGGWYAPPPEGGDADARPPKSCPRAPSGALRLKFRRAMRLPGEVPATTFDGVNASSSSPGNKTSGSLLMRSSTPAVVASRGACSAIVVALAHAPPRTTASSPRRFDRGDAGV